MLTIIEGVLGSDQLQSFRQQLQAADWQDGGISAGSLARTQKRNQQLDDRSGVAVALGNQLLRRLGAMPLFISAALPNRIFPPRFNRYADGGTYGAHVDGALLQLAGSPTMLRTDLSATLFLSEPDDYDGGELEIEGAFGVQSVKLPAGDMVLYPASSLHRVTAVTRGERLASFFWIESMVRDEGERTLLFDLDQTIQALTVSVGAGDANLMKLSAVYHNLLRRWAVT